jgi:hypothetical protein
MHYYTPKTYSKREAVRCERRFPTRVCFRRSSFSTAQRPIYRAAAAERKGSGGQARYGRQLHGRCVAAASECHVTPSLPETSTGLLPCASDAAEKAAVPDAAWVFGCLARDYSHSSIVCVIEKQHISAVDRDQYTQPPSSYNCGRRGSSNYLSSNPSSVKPSDGTRTCVL